MKGLDPSSLPSLLMTLPLNPPPHTLVFNLTYLWYLRFSLAFAFIRIYNFLLYFIHHFCMFEAGEASSISSVHRIDYKS